MTEERDIIFNRVELLEGKETEGGINGAEGTRGGLEKPKNGCSWRMNSNALAQSPKCPPVALLKLSHGRGKFDFEMDFRVVLTHDLEPDVFGRRLIATAILVAHLSF